MSNFAAAAVVSIDDPERVTVIPQRWDMVRVLVSTPRTSRDAAAIYLTHEAARDLVGKLTDALAVTS